MKQLLIKDNQYRSKSDFDEVKDVVNSVADKTLAELEKEGYDNVLDIFIAEYDKGKINVVTY